MSTAQPADFLTWVLEVAPAMFAREIIIRKNLVNGEFWINLFSVCFCLAFSAFYELIECGLHCAPAKMLTRFRALRDISGIYLGYIWDTQSDMALALVGALLAIVSFRRWHDQLLQYAGPQTGHRGLMP